MIKSDKSSDNEGAPTFKDNAAMIQFKVVLWGPGESGKTTNFHRLKERFHHIKITKGFSIDTTDGRTLWNDSVFISFNIELKGQKFNIITQINTATGQERFLSTREYVIEGADGVIFVGDSDPEKLEQNKRSYRELVSFANKKKIPIIIQLNKRDLEGALSLDSFKKHLKLPGAEKYPDGSPVVYETIATEGKNIVSSFEDLVLKMIFNFFTQ